MAKKSVAEQMAEDIMAGRPLAPEAQEPNWMAPSGHEYDQYRTGGGAARVARHPSLGPPAQRRAGTRRVGVSLTLTTDEVETLDRLALVRGVKRGQLLGELIMDYAADVEREWKGRKR